MAKFGSNMKMTVHVALREAMRATFEGPLGCERQSPNASIDLFAFEGGGSIAVDYVEDASAALTYEQHKSMGTWIEFEVAVEAETAALLEACEGVTAFSFVTEHRYFQLPSGQVFRLKR